MSDAEVFGLGFMFGAMVGAMIVPLALIAYLRWTEREAG